MRTDAECWLAAARDPEIARELERVFEATSAAIEARGPACWASGRCCNFDKTGHRLYVTGIEAAYALSRLPAERSIGSSDIERAVVGGGCPFQVANLCEIHALKPLGCRVYFCDRSAQQWQQELSELMLARIRALHERFKLPYAYGEWRELLAIVLEAMPRGTTTSGGSPADAVGRTGASVETSGETPITESVEAPTNALVKDGWTIGLPVISPPRRPQS